MGVPAAAAPVAGPGLRVGIALGLVLLAAAAAYGPGLAGPFVLDDYDNIVRNELLVLASLDWPSLRDAALSSRAGALGRPLPMASFALNHYAAGLSPFAFKLTNLAIHLVNGVLVCLLAAQLVRAAGTEGAGRMPPAALRWMPLAIAALWLLHPLHLTAVLYVVQRMTSSMALFVLAGLVLFLWGRGRLATRPVSALAAMGAGIVGGTALGASCKENAVLLPFFAGLVELVLLERSALPAAARRSLRCFYWLVLGVPAAVAAAVLASHPELVLAGYVDRDFGPVERLLSEARVLFLYLGLTFYPDLAQLGLFHDDIAPSRGLLDPPSTVAAVAGWLALATLAVAARRRWPVASFAVLWFLLAHAVESTVLPLELAFEHRNYLALIGPLLAVVWYLARLLATAAIRPAYAAAALLGLALALGLVTAARSSLWADGGTLIAHAARSHPGSPRALAAAAYQGIAEGRPLPEVYAGFARAAAANPAGIDALLEMAKILRAFAALPPGRREGAGGLPAGAADIETLVGRVETEVGERLRRHAIGAETMGALVAVQECVRRGVDVCRPLLGPAVRWHEIAVASPRRGRLAAARLELSLARLYLFVGEGDRAVALAERAAASDPGDIGFVGQLVELYALLGRWEAAQRAVAELEADTPPGGFRAREVAALRASLESARREAGTGPALGDETGGADGRRGGT